MLTQITTLFGQDVNKEDSTGTGEISKRNEWPHAA
jgi:hypothetical protein